MRNRQSGLSLLEVLIVLALIGAAIGAGAYYHARARQSATVNGLSSAASAMVGKVRAYYKSSGSYAAVTSSNIWNMNLMGEPFYYAIGFGSYMDPWGNAVNITGSAAGGTPTFALRLGGYIDREACIAFGVALASDAAAVHAGNGVEVNAPNGAVSGGLVYKDRSTGALNLNNLRAGCAENAVTYVGFEYR